MCDEKKGLWCYLSAFTLTIFDVQNISSASSLAGLVAGIYAVVYWFFARRTRIAEYKKIKKEIEKIEIEKKAADFQAKYYKERLNKFLDKKERD